MSVVVCLVLGLVLVAAAGLKAAGGPSARAAFATYGVRSPQAMTAAWGAVIAVELTLGALVAAGLDTAARAAAVFLSAATAAQIAALASGRAGAPCACFGAKGRLSTRSAGRTALLAAALALAPLLPRRTPTTEEWLAIGLAAALLGLAALTVVVLALAREVGMLRLSVAPQGALEVAHEGPEVGAHSPLAQDFHALAPGQIGLAVFTSEGCGLCRALKPQIDAFGRHHAIALQTFDEVEHAQAWAAADVPGSPFAVTLDADGTVLSKGTFNTGAQLESVLHAAERRQRMVRA
ncbi:hypothetical protein DVA67_031320 [Solirubrobacter sp. CPCC 204708]|nr:hypothetical protein [Solirubrobacter deserti]